ncbi:MAG: hypothetical protein O3A14_15920 [Cyanobacteria bacterium]|nr:hypothetical protein [Cyanobacteriota bacterium]
MPNDGRRGNYFYITLHQDAVSCERFLDAYPLIIFDYFGGESVAKKGIKSARGVPEKYDEIKGSVCYSLTPTAKINLKNLAIKNGMCPSEFLERLARGEYSIQVNESDDARSLDVENSVG